SAGPAGRCPASTCWPRLRPTAGSTRCAPAPATPASACRRPGSRRTAPRRPGQARCRRAAARSCPRTGSTARSAPTQGGSSRWSWGAPLSSSLSLFSSGDGEDGGGVAVAWAVDAAQPPVDGAHGAADHLRDLAGGQPRLAQRREPRDGHLSGRGLLRGGGLLDGPLLGGARGVAALAAVRVVGRVVVLLRLGGGDSGVDRVDDVLP